MAAGSGLAGAGDLLRAEGVELKDDGSVDLKNMDGTAERQGGEKMAYCDWGGSNDLLTKYHENMKMERQMFQGIPVVLYCEEAEKGYLFVHGQGGNKEEVAAFAEIAVPLGFLIDLPGHG